ncbi:hydantoinase B/oxoprolinase family protein [Baekduia soli]|uniref:Hydantoinase B/oxoprolinase family protein n=1 Tax=Baekduia soli TaxID=496014 RepID=A0A5B8U3J4_9ACTN|nr:hydantoinase B/oxoprolinase family protein [Baekduia soli]QEC47425.1 hydantoinase B/oxoprolinase family protein [Baekduia soli]
MASLDTTTVDPITYEVISHRLWSINEEGATTIVHASGSPVVHATDYNFGIYSATGELAVSGVFYTIPIYVMQMVIAEVLDRFPDDVGPGDVFVTNDPFIAGIHQSDVQFVAPFFHDGELVAWTGCMAHLMDVGGMLPGSWCPGATEVFQEGMLIPPARIVTGGDLNRGLWDMILSNSRLPAMVANDMSAFLSAHRVAQARLTEAIDVYGAAAVIQTMETSIDRTEQQMREWLLELPDGRFQHQVFIDHDGHENRLFKINCTLIKEGDRMIFDFHGSDDAIVGLGNASRSGTYGSIGSAILGIFGSRLPWNGGLVRMLEVRSPDNSVVSAEKPMPISAGSTGAAYLVECLALTCFGKMLAFSEKYQDYVCGPADGSWLLTVLGGKNQFGEAYAAMPMDALGWGGPAFRFRDGVDTGGAMFVPGGGFNDVELTESRDPLLFLWRRENLDSGGAGRQRGGNGMDICFSLYDTDEPSKVAGALQGMVVPNTVGVFGAYPGATSHYEQVKGSTWRRQFARDGHVAEIKAIEGEHFVPEAKATLVMQPEDVLHLLTQNAGGYGDPLERDPQRVLADLIGGSVSAPYAAAVYGVVMTEGPEVDGTATAAKRDEIRAHRLASAQNLQPHYDTRDDLPVAARWADTLILLRDGEQILVQSASSGAVLGPLGENWRDVAPWRSVPAAEVGPGVVLDERLELLQYLDPLTGRSLWMDVHLKGDPLPVDFVLPASVLAGDA